MQKNCYNYISIFILAIAFSSITLFGGIQTYRLESAQHELRQVRIELESSRDQFEYLTGSIEATRAILNESADTVADIRSQLEAVRENYEQMEDAIDGFRNNSYN